MPPPSSSLSPTYANSTITLTSSFRLSHPINGAGDGRGGGEQGEGISRIISLEEDNFSGRQIVNDIPWVPTPYFYSSYGHQKWVKGHSRWCREGLQNEGRQGQGL